MSQTSNSSAKAKREAPEEYLRRCYPGAFQYAFDCAFGYEYKMVEGTSFISKVSMGPDILWARMLGILGSPEAPIVWVPEHRRFYKYRNELGIYEPTHPEIIRDEFAKIIDRCAEAIDKTDPGLSKKLARFRTHLHSHRVARSVEGQCILHAEMFERMGFRLHVQNGVIDPATLALVPHSPDLPSLSRVETEWSTDPPAPVRFMEYLARMLSNPADIELLLDCLALSFIGNPTHTILLLAGDGGAGKSTLIRLLELLLGGFFVRELRLRHAAERFEATFWAMARVLYLPELTSAVLSMHPAMLKAISGQDRLQVEFKGSSETFSVRPKALVVAHTNSQIAIPVDRDESAWERRLVILPVSGGTGARQPNARFAESLFAEEGSAILRLLVTRANRLHAAPSLPVEQRHRDLVSAALGRQDPLRTFVKQALAVERGSSVTFDDACVAAREFLGDRGHHIPRDEQIISALRTLTAEIHEIRESRSLGSTGKAQGWRRLALVHPDDP